jgi:hypothetical protein
MIANGYDVAVLEHHTSSSSGGFPNQYAAARLSYYGISGIPNSYFDGVLNVLGGGSGTYNSFVSKYNQRMAIPSDFTVLLNGMSDGLDYTVVLTMENVEPYSGSNLVAHLAVNESGLAYGSSTYNFVTRLFVPNASGTPVDFSSNPLQTVTLNFTMNSAWNLENCEFIAFIQDNSTKEILQAAKVSVLDIIPLTNNNASIQTMDMVPVANCAGEVAPLVTISNEGAQSLTSLNINYVVNGDASETYEWTGDLSFQTTEEVQLPPLSFVIQDENDLVIYVTDPNGNDDEDTSNDTITSTFAIAAQVVPDIFLFIKLDDNPGEITWDCKDSEGQILYSGGPYSTPNSFIKDTIFNTEEGCYTFVINDAGGDGLTGAGFYRLTGGDGTEIIFNTDFESSNELVEFGVMLTGVETFNSGQDFNIYPNPFENYTNVSFTMNSTEKVELNLYDVTGKVVYSLNPGELNAGSHSLKIDAQDLRPGIYFVSLKIGDNLLSKKVSVN